VHFANDIRDSLTVGLLVVVALSRNLALQRQGYVRFRPEAAIPLTPNSAPIQVPAAPWNTNG
jgi:hypothetical protein